MIVLPAAVLMLKGQAFRLDRGLQHKLDADDLFHAGFSRMSLDRAVPDPSKAYRTSAFLLTAPMMASSIATLPASLTSPVGVFEPAHASI
jgi:hypothetical protein